MNLYKNITLLSLITLLFMSCNDKGPQPKVNYEQDADTTAVILQDTTKTQIADLPVSFDSTEVLMQISGLVNIEDLKKDGISRYSLSSMKKDSRYSDDEFYTTSPTNDILRGWFTNIYFDDIIINKQQLLTKETLFVQSIHYLRKVAKKNGQHYLLYSVYDKDSNRDGKITTEDLKSLYISKLNGDGFRRITESNHEYIRGSFNSTAYRYYFITLEDVNRDGFFNKGDKYHYYYIDLLNNDYQVIEYNPINRE